MRRLPMRPRDDWRQRADRLGFAYHSISGETYWDESICYSFTLREIEDDIEAATAELWALCREFVSRAIDRQETFERLRIPRVAWNLIAESWKRRDPSLYGRFDFAYDGNSPPKLLEFNADTPTAVFEAAVFQWDWLEDCLSRGLLPPDGDQFNSLHERLVARWREIGGGAPVHFACMGKSVEDSGTVAYIEGCAKQAGLMTSFLDIAKVGLRRNTFVDLSGGIIQRLFKLYPWEFMFADAFGSSPAMARTRFVEPPWKMLLSNKGALVALWEMEPGHPNLLPTYFEGEWSAGKLGRRYARKPIWSREGANVALVDGATVIAQSGGTYGAEGFVQQLLINLPEYSGNFPVIGSWIVGDEPAGMGIREDSSPITTDRARFVPHFISDGDTPR
jgi:glutathionylspermidine synthase